MTDDAIVDCLHDALAKAQAEMDNAKFDSVNPHFKSKYASIAAIRDAVTPALTKYGLSLNHETKVREDGSTILYGVLAHGVSGQQQRSEWLITGDTPQARGSELTYGRRYTACMLTGIVGEADDDANAAEDEKPDYRQQATSGGPEQLTKAASRTVYTQLVKEMTAAKSKDALFKWGAENRYRVHAMHADLQIAFTKAYSDHRTAIEVGADEEGNEVIEDSEFKKKLRESLDDEIPEEGGGDAAA